NYINWLALFIPPIFLFVIVLWAILIILFPLEKLNSTNILNSINESLKGMGRLNTKERKMLIIMSITILLWSFEFFHNIPITTIGILGAMLTVLPKAGVWQWDEARKKINWDFLIFISVNLSIANMLIDSGTLNWAASIIISVSSFFKYNILFLLFFLTCILFLRSFFASVFGFIAIVVPISYLIGDSIYGISPTVLSMASYFIGLPGFFFIPQSSVNILTYDWGFYRQS